MTELFPQRLRELRQRRGTPQSVLSELCGLSRGAVWRYERGEALPSLLAAIAIADFFGVSLDYLCGRSDNSGTAQKFSTTISTT